MSGGEIAMLSPPGLSLSSFFHLLGKGLVKLEWASLVGVMVCACLILGGLSSTALAVPTAEEVLKALAISDSDQAAIRKGEIVRWTTTEGSDRELAVGVALLVPGTPTNLASLFREAVTYKIVGSVTAYGEISGTGTLGDFAGVKLEPNGADEANRYLDAEPGDTLNLDAKEISAFQVLNRKDGAQPAVEALVREKLLTRYQAYRQRGLSGIPSYDRGDGESFQLGQDLLLATNQSQVLEKFCEKFYQILLKYPAVDTTPIEDWFYWVNVEVFGRPTFILSHRMLFDHSGIFVTADRHFYASHEYNGLQSIAGTLPVKEGSLFLVLYRISTDGVAGFGSSMKHPVARGLMGPYMEEMFEGIRAKVQ
jgi:hypothetical protein